MLGSEFVKFLTSVLKWQVNSSLDFASFFIVMIHNSSVDFKLILFYFGIKHPIKIPILRLSSDLLKICHIPHVIFQNSSQFFSKFCIIIQCREKQLLCTLLRQTLNTLHNRSKWKCMFWRLLSPRIKFNQIFVTFETAGQVFSKFWINLQGHEI